MTGSGDGTDRESAGISLARALAPAIGLACDGRLGPIDWFRTDWQRGGAATGTAAWRGDDPRHPGEAVVKMPVGGRELRWFRRLGDGADPPVARLLASGDELDGRDFGWVVMEKLPFGPLSRRWGERPLQRLAEAAARFHARAADFPVDRTPDPDAWEERLRAARERAREASFPLRSRWSAALREATKRLAAAVARWEARQPLGWLHGDLHPANAMSRTDGDDAPAVLIDLGEVRSGHWVEDGVYLERLLWTGGHPSPLKPIAEARKRLGLENGEWAPLAACRRFLLAATAPAFGGERAPAFLAANLERLEASFRELPRGS